MMPHILIIDADQGAARATQALMAWLTAHCTLAVEPTPERGRLHLQEHPADVLIIDPSPYNLAADELIAWLKAEHPASCVIVLASAATAGLRQRMERLKIDLFQEKHQPPAMLIPQLRGVLRRFVQPAPTRAGCAGPDSDTSGINRALQYSSVMS